MQLVTCKVKEAMATAVPATGGTESILCALKSYRDWGRAKGITRANVVCCVTAHAAFDKAGEYFDIEIRHARADTKTQRVDVGHVRRLMDSNTGPTYLPYFF